MSGIHKEKLRQHLNNAPLVQTLRHKREIDETKKALRDALVALQGVGISEAAQTEIAGKIEEYKTIGINYGNMIEDTWHITWQMESIIKRYLDYDGELPEFAKF